MSVLGIDPGASGALVVLDSTGGVEEIVKAPRSAPETASLVGELRLRFDIQEAALEDIFGAPGQGANGLVNFGKQHGWLEAALACHGVRYRIVRSNDWQKLWPSLKKKKPGESQAAKKERHKAEAMRLFPGVTVTLWNCDALLIAEWLRREAGR